MDTSEIAGTPMDGDPEDNPENMKT